MEPLEVPGSRDVAGKPRWRSRYLWWHAWPAEPTRQDLRDFMFTQMVASAVAIVAGAAVLLALIWGRFDIVPRIWPRVELVVWGTLALAGAYYAFVYWDWQRKRAA